MIQELQTNLAENRKIRDKIILDLLKAKEAGNEEEVEELERKLKEINNNIKKILLKKDDNRIYCSAKLEKLKNNIIKEELKLLGENPQESPLYCPLKSACIVCLDSKHELGNHFIEGASVKENLEIIDKQQYLKFKITIPTNNIAHTYNFTTKLHVRKVMTNNESLRQKLIKANFNPNNILFEDFIIDITNGIVHQFFGTCFEESLKSFTKMIINIEQFIDIPLQ